METIKQGKRKKKKGKKVVSLLKVFLPFTLYLLPFSLAYAASSQDFFQKGNQAYAQGQFTQAVTAYESAESQGLENWVLLYNLGNAYYKSDQLGKAVASYARAFRLNPASSDLQFNFNMALTRAGDPLFPNGALASLCWRLFYAIPLNLLTGIASLLAIALMICTGLFFLGRLRMPAETVFGMVVLVTLFGLWCGLRIQAYEKKEAVIIVPTAEVRSGPTLSSTANFNVPEGRRVVLLDEQEPVRGWLEIGIPSEGLKGWIPETSVEVL